MVAAIGILGETTVVTQGVTTTVYTVPASKSARIRVLFGMEGGVGTVGYRVHIGTPGTEMNIGRDISGGDDVLSGMQGTGSLVANTIGLVEGAGILDITSNSGEHVLAPFPYDYYLSTGDTVRVFILTGDAVDHLFQVHGVEDDA